MQEVTGSSPVPPILPMSPPKIKRFDRTGFLIGISALYRVELFRKRCMKKDVKSINPNFETEESKPQCVNPINLKTT